MSILTKHGQSVYDLAKEFAEALKKSSGNDKGGKLDESFAKYLELESSPEIPDFITDSIAHAGRSNYNCYTNKIFQKFKPKISDILISWVANFSSGIPGYIEVYLGLLCVLFYKDHTKQEVITLKWYSELVGQHPGKAFGFSDIYPWYMAIKATPPVVAQGDMSGYTIFDAMTDEEMFRLDTELDKEMM
jgi:hypothetical protein